MLSLQNPQNMDFLNLTLNYIKNMVDICMNSSSDESPNPQLSWDTKINQLGAPNVTLCWHLVAIAKSKNAWKKHIFENMTNPEVVACKKWPYNFSSSGLQLICIVFFVSTLFRREIMDVVQKSVNTDFSTLALNKSNKTIDICWHVSIIIIY